MIRTRLQNMADSATAILREGEASGSIDETESDRLAWLAFDLLYMLGHVDLIPPAFREEARKRVHEP